MKKHLIAAAVAGALAVPAMAQVTVSGAVEVGYGSVETTATNTNRSLVGNAYTTSNITFKGSEDLGGGLKASFQLTQEFDPATGELDDTSAGAGQFQTAFVGLAGGFGNVRLGTMAHAARDAGGVYRFFGNIGRLPGDFNSSDTRKDTIQYISPKFGGFNVSLGSSDEGKTAGTAADGRLTSFGVRGDIAGFKVSVGQETSKTSAGVKTKYTSTGGSYNLGMAKVGLVYVEKKTDNDDKLKATLGQVAIPVSGAVTLGLAYGQYEDSATGGGDSTMTSLIAQYKLSKRTMVIGSYQTLKSDAAGAVGGSTRGLGVEDVAGETMKGYNISVVHKF
jgi:predicted porin